jgi:RNA polymerase sigma factor (sigma-70 family)
MHSRGRRLIQDLWSEHRVALQTFFRRRIASSCDAADLTQEVYLRLLRAADKREIVNPEAYLFTVARNLLIEHVVSQRDQAAQEAVTFRDPVFAEGRAADSGVEGEIDREAQLQRLREAIQKLNGPQQAALLLAYQQDLSYTEIAKKLNVHRSMVGKYVIQALNACRQYLEGA